MIALQGLSLERSAACYALPRYHPSNVSPLPGQERARPRHPAREVVTRLLGAAAALALAVIVSLFGTSLSVGRQPRPEPSLDPHLFTVIVPTAPTAGDAATATPAAPIVDFRDFASLQARAAAALPLPRLGVLQPRSTTTRTVTPTVGNSHRVRGGASWYCLPGVSACTSGYPGGLYAAAGSELRIGRWRGRTVRVCGNGHCVYVRLIDTCACGGSRIIDLYSDAFRRLAPLSKGSLLVTVSW